MNIECPHFCILQDIVTSHVCQSITVLTVAHKHHEVWLYCLI